MKLLCSSIGLWIACLSLFAGGACSRNNGGTTIDPGTPSDGGAGAESGNSAVLPDVPQPPVDPGGPTGNCAPTDLGTSVGEDIAVGTTVGKSNAVVPDCAPPGNASDTQFLWSAPYTAFFTFDTAGSSFDTVLYLIENDCAGAILACNDEAGGPQSRVRREIAEGTKVIIVVDGFDAEAGSFRLSITEATDSEVGLCTDGVDNDRDGDSDCDDSDCSDGAGCAEVNCADGIDDDGDGDIDCDDWECYDSSACTESDCSNGVDDDGDGDIDCDDWNCEYEDVCIESNCADGIDNDSDGRADCADSNCRYEDVCEETNCADGIDNEGDGAADCDDSDCNDAPACIESLCGDGLDNDDDGRMDCTDSDCEDSSECNEAGRCTDGIDNDSDTKSDCTDTECRCDPACMPAESPCPSGGDLGSNTGTVANGNSSGGCSYRRGTCGSTSTAPEVTYTWTAPADGRYAVDLEGSDYDTLLYVLNGSCTGTELACNDDAGGSGVRYSKVIVTLTAGQVITIVVDGYSSSSGAFLLNIKSAT